MKKYRNLIFDIGNVLLDYEWWETLLKLGYTHEETMEIGNAIFNDPDGLWSQYDRGVISVSNLVKEYSRKHPHYAKAFYWVIDHSEYLPRPRPLVWDKVKKLRDAGYGIYLLSNYGGEMFAKHTQYADFMDYADGMIISYRIHAIKPEPEIYQALFSKYNLNPAECIFFDDKEENVASSKALGMDAVQIKSEQQLLEELEAFL